MGLVYEVAIICELEWKAAALTHTELHDSGVHWVTRWQSDWDWRLEQ